MHAVLVLGMHRSGTSALTQVVNRLGFEVMDSLLDADSQNEADADVVRVQNADGYFEDADVIRLNDQLLETLQASWDAPRHLKAQASLLREYEAEAVDILRVNYADHARWVLKDPRLCVTLDFWQTVIFKAFPEIKLTAVHILRHPLEVAGSQQRRANDLPGFHILGGEVRYGLLLWLQYLRALVEDNRIADNYMVSYTELLSAPREVVQAVATFLGVEEDEWVQAASETIKPRLRTQSNQDALSSRYPDFGFMETLYERLIDQFNNQGFSPSEMRLAVDEQMQVSPMLSLDALADVAFDAGASARKQWRVRMYYEAVAEQRRERLLEAERYVAEITEGNKILTAQVVELQETASATYDDLLATQEYLAKTGEALTATQEQLVSTEGVLAATQEQLVSTEGVLAATQEQLAATQEQLQAREAELAAMTASLSWRLTAPLRATKHYFEVQLRYGVRTLIWFLRSPRQLARLLLWAVTFRYENIWRRWRAVYTLQQYPSQLRAGFDSEWYVATYPDVAGFDGDPLLHYLAYGAVRGNKPTPNFDPAWYQQTYPDVVQSGIEPFTHYVVFGQFEGRSPGPVEVGHDDLV